MTGLECREFVELVTPCDEELDDPDAERLQAHRSGCGGCERYAQQLDRTVRLVRAEPWDPPATR